jgi:hypothetical protein
MACSHPSWLAIRPLHTSPASKYRYASPAAAIASLRCGSPAGCPGRTRQYRSVSPCVSSSNDRVRAGPRSPASLARIASSGSAITVLRGRTRPNRPRRSGPPSRAGR